jgi:coenzyme F420 hydrogenase subunit beta
MQNQKNDGQCQLIEKVIDRGICVKCGACVGLCPYFDYFDGKVVVMERCQVAPGRCLQICPRAEYEETSLKLESQGDSEIGPLREILMARALDMEVRQNAQYGGVVSALLVLALENRTIRSVVLTDAGDGFSPGGRVAESKADVLQCSGSRYSASGTLSALNAAVKEGREQIAFVGLPCQMEALMRMKHMEPDGSERSARVSLKVGLFCTWALDYRAVAAFLREKGLYGPYGKFDIPPPPSEKFLVETEEGWNEFPLAEMRPMVQPGCALCRDMTAEWADISVGTAEGHAAWNTVIIRTEAGAEIFEEAMKRNLIETDRLPAENFDHLKEAAHNKRERGRAAGDKLARNKQPRPKDGAFIWPP